MQASLRPLAVILLLSMLMTGHDRREKGSEHQTTLSSLSQSKHTYTFTLNAMKGIEEKQL